ncbi:MAG: type II toxin-antitoxin system RelE/ParE family toxin [Streptococcaceae bacterium]|jgi:toxin ParE1/3/4|nr:type II toxin-antitoxin system RelE/ParE family toxin [Streptococcaceae bacterium]
MVSKKYTLEISPDAERDLDEIDNYLRHHFLSEQAAESIMGNIKTSLSDLIQFPEIGINAADRIGKEKLPDIYQNIRMIISGSYLIFYVLEGSTVQIYRVLYQKRDWINLFRK